MTLCQRNLVQSRQAVASPQCCPAETTKLQCGKSLPRATTVKASTAKQPQRHSEHNINSAKPKSRPQSYQKTLVDIIGQRGSQVLQVVSKVLMLSLSFAFFAMAVAACIFTKQAFNLTPKYSRNSATNSPSASSASAQLFSPSHRITSSLRFLAARSAFSCCCNRNLAFNSRNLFSCCNHHTTTTKLTLIHTHST